MFNKGIIMNLKKNCSFVIAIIIVSSTLGFPQHLKIGVGGGITQITGPESLTNDISATEPNLGAGFSTEWNAGLLAKLELPLVPITPRAFIFYHSLSASKEFPEIVANPKIENSQSIWEYGLGAQYNFIPVPLGLDPYIALDIFSSSIGGFSTEINGEESKSDGVHRFGGSIGLGTEISIIPVVNLDLLLSYKLFNLVGKEDGEDTISGITLDAFILFNL
jgi:hypothetical protein